MWWVQVLASGCGLPLTRAKCARILHTETKVVEIDHFGNCDTKIDIMTEKVKKHDLVLRAIEGFQSAAVEIVNLFAEKHGWAKYDDKDVYFVDEFCDVCMIGDYAFSLQTMIEDLKGDLPTEELLPWYDYVCDYMQVFGKAEGCPNFKSWCQGCPRVDLAPIMQKQEELEKMIREAKAF